MPELPEVTVTLAGISEVVVGNTIDQCTIRNRNLRWPIAPGLESRLVGQVVQTTERRGKYMLLHLSDGCLVWHLGMSGRISISPLPGPALTKHDHIDIICANQVLRFNDPRRFSAFFLADDPQTLAQLQRLGPEPLTDSWNAQYLIKSCQGRKQAIKPLIMDQAIVVGIGNIYACEALFLANVHPGMAAAQLTLQQAMAIVLHSKAVLSAAIKQGGTTLKDFMQTDGQNGYFAVSLNVYGKTSQPCPKCASLIMRIRLGQRSTFYCPTCQSG